MSSIQMITGTWTPTLAFGGASTGITYSKRVGLYSIIGAIIFVQFEITLSSVGSATGNATISGLSTPISNVAQNFMMLSDTTQSLGKDQCVLTIPTGANPIMGLISQRINAILDFQTSLTNTGFSNTSTISGSFRGII